MKMSIIVLNNHIYIVLYKHFCGEKKFEIQIEIKNTCIDACLYTYRQWKLE